MKGLNRLGGMLLLFALAVGVPTAAIDVACPKCGDRRDYPTVSHVGSGVVTTLLLAFAILVLSATSTSKQVILVAEATAQVVDNYDSAGKQEEDEEEEEEEEGLESLVTEDDDYPAPRPEGETPASNDSVAEKRRSDLQRQLDIDAEEVGEPSVVTEDDDPPPPEVEPREDGDEPSA